MCGESPSLLSHIAPPVHIDIDSNDYQTVPHGSLVLPTEERARRDPADREKIHRKSTKFAKITHFHSPLHEIRADRTPVFHRSFESCVLRRSVKENRGVLNLFREISIETRVFFVFYTQRHLRPSPRETAASNLFPAIVT